jgi:copper transport protein
MFTVAPQVASSHAVLLRADPPSGRTLDQLPSQVRLLFSEPIDPSFSRLYVLDALGERVDLGDGRVDPDDDHWLIVSVQPGLPDGVYTVVWRSLSTIDIHPGSGDFPLFLRVPATTTTGATGVAQSESTPATVLARWWLYLAASAFGGTLIAWKFVFGPKLATGDASLRAAALRRAERLAIVAGGLLLLGTFFAAIAQAAAAAGTPLEGALGGPVTDLLTRGRYASIWWPRLAISVAAVAIVAWRGIDDAWSESAAAMIPAVLLTNSLTSHAATLPSMAFVAVLLDWLHVIGAAVWVGGLASLVVIAPLLARAGSDGTLLGPTVGRFTQLAGLAVVVLLLSGTAQSALEVGSLDGLVGTTYGRAVLVKVGIFAAMLGVAFVNRRRSGLSSGRRWSFVRGVRLELLLAVAALGVAAVLTGTTPAWQYG